VQPVGVNGEEGGGYVEEVEGLGGRSAQGDLEELGGAYEKGWVNMEWCVLDVDCGNSAWDTAYVRCYDTCGVVLPYFGNCGSDCMLYKAVAGREELRVRGSMYTYVYRAPLIQDGCWWS
jgi:hypothetical protein